jgi:hypothetical protein
MKPPTVFLGEMTSREVEAFLEHHQTVIVPTGSLWDKLTATGYAKGR